MKKEQVRKGSPYQNNYEELDSHEEGVRPRVQSAVVNAPKQNITAANFSNRHANLASAQNRQDHQLAIRTINEEPLRENEIDSPSVFGQSTKTLGMDSLQKQRLRAMLIQEHSQKKDRVLLMNFTDLSIFSEFPDLIVQEAFTENETVRKVNKGIDENHLFKLLAIDASAPINLKWVV